MKKTLITLSIILGCIGILKAQFIQKPEKIFKRYTYADIFDNDTILQEMKLTGTFHYNDRGAISSYECAIDYGNYGNAYYRKNYWYDNHLHIIKYSYSGYDGGGLYGADSVYYIYDNDLLSYTKKLYVNKWGGWYYTDSIRYYYDDEGNVNHIDNYVKNDPGDDWWLGGVTNHYPTENGEEVITTKYHLPNAIQFQETMHYDLEGELLYDCTERYNFSGIQTSGDRITYSYEDGLCHSKTTQKWVLSDSCWVNDSYLVFNYNNLGIKTEEVAQTWVDDQWQNTQRTHWEMDENGIMLSITYEIWTDSLFINSKRVEYQHENGQCIGMVGLVWSGESWVLGMAGVNGVGGNNERIFWDESLRTEDNLIRATHHSFTNVTIIWQTVEIEFPRLSEWYYELKWDDGSTTYQHLEYAADTTIGTERPKIIVRSNTHYDRDTTMEVTHEYIYEEGGKVYWWNKDLEEFTILYDYAAEVGDEWEIKVGTESITVHVDEVDVFEYDGHTRKRLHISDIGDLFGGDIVVGFGHMTNFFPEKLMNQGKGYRVDGLRCYWVEDALLYHNGDGDCDAIYGELHGVEEDGPSAPSTGSGTEGSGGLTVYPNPASNILFVRLPQCDSPTAGQTEYRIINLMGQTLLQGTITAENQQINIEKLPAGMYFISINGETVKFVVK